MGARAGWVVRWSTFSNPFVVARKEPVVQVKTIMKTIFLAALFFLLVGSALAGPLQPDQATRPEPTPTMAAPIRFFQNYLSGADGHRCPMTPSCSSYALQAIQRHGAIQGWIMACDRLMRCGHDELNRSPSVLTRQGIRCQDTVQNNDFWLR